MPRGRGSREERKNKREILEEEREGKKERKEERGERAANKKMGNCNAIKEIICLKFWKLGVLGRIMLPFPAPRGSILITGTCKYVTLLGERDFNVIKLRIFKCRDYLGLARWPTLITI